MPEKPKGSSGTGRKRRFRRDELEDLVEEATIDAYGEEEQVTSFCTVLDERLVLPFDTILLDVDVTVEKLDLTDRGHDIPIVLRRGLKRQRLPLLDLPLSHPPPKGWDWVKAYRFWARPWRGRSGRARALAPPAPLDPRLRRNVY